MMNYTRTILVTGGAGFIGSHVVRRFVKAHPDFLIVNFDALTYAGNLENLKDIEDRPNYAFFRGDICHPEDIDRAFGEFGVTDIIHLAAESHVDRSILDPLAFVRTNVMGTANLLHAARTRWTDDGPHRFYHVSTDEVYGSLGAEGFFTESTPYDPRSPYSASKASSDHLVRSFHHTFGLPVVISNCSNNYGPHQFPEKLIPLFISNIVDRKPLPVYGKGENVRDWLYVEDHAEAIEAIFLKGSVGETYNIGGNNEWSNIELIRELCRQMDRKLERAEGESKKLITYVRDREGHDFRYAIDCSKLTEALGWEPRTDFKSGLGATIDWYLQHPAWIRNVKSGAYQQYYEEQYSNRS